jgi:hypothetical protein
MMSRRWWSFWNGPTRTRGALVTTSPLSPVPGLTGSGSADRQEELAAVDHPVGQPVEQVVHAAQAGPISWHYVSLRIAVACNATGWN